MNKNILKYQNLHSDEANTSDMDYSPNTSKFFHKFSFGSILKSVKRKYYNIETSYESITNPFIELHVYESTNDQIGSKNNENSHLNTINDNNPLLIAPDQNSNDQASISNNLINNDPAVVTSNENLESDNIWTGYINKFRNTSNVEKIAYIMKIISISLFFCSILTIILLYICRKYGFYDKFWLIPFYFLCFIALLIFTNCFYYIYKTKEHYSFNLVLQLFGIIICGIPTIEFFSLKYDIDHFNKV